MITGGVFQILIDAQIAFGRSERGVAVRQLNLLDSGPALVGQLAVGAAQIVRLQCEGELFGLLEHDPVDGGGRHPLPNEPPAFIHFP
jgi:hypothetical protein